MSLVINTNINSLNTQNNLAKSQNALSQATQRLSSGLKINSAADNAAGFAISQRYTTQIGGLAQASANASDAINLAQTAGSALDQVTANLQAIRDLAAQAANGTYSASDRATIDAEVQQRLSEVTRIANQTTFNGTKVLDGSFGSKTFQIGANVGQTVSVGIASGVRADQMGAIATTSSGDISAKFSAAAGLTLAAGDLSVGGTNVAAGNYTTAASLVTAINTAATASGYTGTFASVSGNEISFDNNTSSAIALAGAKASSVLGVSSVAGKTGGVSTTTDGTGASTGVAAAFTSGGGSLVLGAGELSVNGTDLAGTYASVTDLATAINTAIGGGSTLASASGGELAFDNSTASAVTFTGTSQASLGVPGTVAAQSTSTTPVVDGAATSTGVNTAVTAAATSALTLGSGDLTIDGKDITGTFANVQALSDAINATADIGVSSAVNKDGTGFNLYSPSSITASSSSTGALGTTSLADSSATLSSSNSLQGGDVLTVDDANALMSRVDVALTSVASLAANLGAVQNRFQSTISTLSAQTTNLQASQSTIQDADFAAETANLSKANVLQQAGISVLAQANASPQQVLKLLQ